ncbi:3-deoxy-manno-octulosonate cytidylyltransferase (CMP-KDO synthetase) [Sinobacterium caligoides]|uniref:3-deoxy-manno-octulosonate cytidylyltransferase n=1 Tax=Sinobacterium caligoides TaxID=933926 RepID=A0A3N2DKG0_9GAMM|nr:3-deoxy-manno-octulosonate cytidylyltransferase [Sinobacterium caligoides]ROS00281.1 3-deoxy-manno-octulosonate cytidylyltransferase (CMP-KDO synthetase) [Sinobacterium caligoides]
MSFTVIIPSRYSSTRLPGKPLKDLAGQTMIERVYRQALRSEAERVVIATDDVRIEELAKNFGAEVCMTRADHESGTDRLQEAAAALGLSATDVVVNVQGDEPLIPPAIINQVAENLASHPASAMSTLSIAIDDAAEFYDPNCVKVIANVQGTALYFSRSPIPFPRDEKTGALPTAMIAQRHIGIYGYRVGLLNDFVQWPVSPLEATEKLEQLRVMWHGHHIHVETACELPPAGIDTEADLLRVRHYLAEQQGGK